MRPGNKPGQAAGLPLVFAGEQFDHEFGAGEPAGGVQARPQFEADILSRDRRRTELADFQQGADARVCRATQGGQTGCHEDAVLVH